MLLKYCEQQFLRGQLNCLSGANKIRAAEYVKSSCGDKIIIFNPKIQKKYAPLTF